MTTATASATLALYVQLEAKPGKENEVADFLRSALPIVQQEPGTIAWFAIRMGPRTFGIFDAFPDESSRQAHLNGQVAAALKARASDLFANTPDIQKIDVLASKLP
jgi:quinol monooxygenase YgiN